MSEYYFLGFFIKPFYHTPSKILRVLQHNEKCKLNNGDFFINLHKTDENYLFISLRSLQPSTYNCMQNYRSIGCANSVMEYTKKFCLSPHKP